MFLGRDARQALADYLQVERPGDAAASTSPVALFLSATSVAARRPDGRLSPRSIKTIVAELERRLGHANDRYLRLYTNPPDDIARRLRRRPLISQARWHQHCL